MCRKSIARTRIDSSASSANRTDTQNQFRYFRNAEHFGEYQSKVDSHTHRTSWYCREWQWIYVRWVGERFSNWSNESAAFRTAEISIPKSVRVGPTEPLVSAVDPEWIVVNWNLARSNLPWTDRINAERHRGAFSNRRWNRSRWALALPLHLHWRRAVNCKISTKYSSAVETKTDFIDERCYALAVETCSVYREF